MRNHAMRGVFSQMSDDGFPAEVVEAIRDSVDCNLYFFDHKVEIGTMLLILSGSILLLIGIYILMNTLSKRKV